MKVVIATPFYEMKAYSPYLVSLLNSARILWGAGVEFDYYDLSGDSYVDRAKNTICARFLESGATDLLMIDSDMQWDASAIVKVLKAPQEVVGGTYPVKNNWEHYGCLIDVNDDGTPVVDDETGLIRACWLPGGFLRLKRTALERFQAAYPDLTYRDASADPLARDRTYTRFFECTVTEHGQRRGEDVTFCDRFRAAGGQVWIEPRITFVHYGVKGWGGSYHDFLRRQPGGDLGPQKVTDDLPMVSIVITCYRYARFLGDAIESALAQTYPNVEVIVVDDGSPDDTGEVAARYPVTYIRQDNRGNPAARNTGTRAARGDWICCLDADDRLCQTFVEKTVGKADVVGSALELFGNESRVETLPAQPTADGMRVHNMVMSGALHRREVWEKVGGWDEMTWGKGGYEDWDFWLRALRHGFRVVNVDEPLYEYRKHGESQVTDAVRRHGELRQRILAKDDEFLRSQDLEAAHA